MKKLFLSLISLWAVSAYSQRTATLDTLIKITDTVQLNLKLQQMLSTGTEDELESLVRFYNVKKKYNMRDSVYNVGAKRFPLSDYAFEVARQSLMKIEDPKKQRKQYLAIRKKFLQKGVNDMRYGMMEGALVQARIDDKDLKGATAYMDSIRNPQIYAYSARLLYSLSPAIAEKMLKKFISRYGTTADAGTNNAIAAAYGNILIKNKKEAEAVPYIKEAYKQAGKWVSQELVKDYVTILLRENNYEEIVKVLETAVRNGQGNAEVRTQLVEMYKKTNRDADASIKALNAELAKRVRETIAPKIISKPSPQFTVTDSNGQLVSLTDLKGKVVVVDFWATWCVPCKKSFPAMQQSVNRYSADSNVVFLFVHTWERGDTNAKVNAAKYLTDNKYNFGLYMDTYDSISKSNPAVTAFAVTGIPTKFVIDGQGNIRFIINGYSGMDEETIEEMSVMIEMAKKG
ncbi:MAG: redoxin domain-containing protein [Lacibacter sp.]